MSGFVYVSVEVLLLHVIKNRQKMKLSESANSLKLALSLVLIYLLNSSEIIGKQIYLTVQTLDITVPMNHSSIKRNVNQGMNLCCFRQLTVAKKLS